MPSTQPVAESPGTISLDAIRTQWRSMPAIAPDTEEQPANLEQELETYLNAATFNTLLKIDDLEHKLKASSNPLSDEQLAQIHSIKRQVEFCAYIGLYSLRRMQD